MLRPQSPAHYEQMAAMTMATLGKREVSSDSQQRPAPVATMNPRAAVQDLARLQAVATTPPPSREAAIAHARAALAPSLKDREAPTYPAAALGPLAEACEAIATAGQVRPAMVGQCLLGAASLLTQGLFNVDTLNGKKPLSLYLLTLGDSGDGKSTSQGVALQPVIEWQRSQAKRYADALADYDAKKTTRKKVDVPPGLPAPSFRLVSDATVEGLRRDLDTGPCAQGVFTDEAASILAGYGMSADHRAKTAGVFSKLWDNGHLSVSRVTGGRVEKHGRRIALHWLIQPIAASDSIGDALLSALGFWPRFLAAWPEPQAPRLAQAFRPETLPAVGAYWQRCAALLAEPLGDDAGDCLALPLADGARTLLGQAFEQFEREGRRGELRVVKPFALRASEQACRIAGVLTAFAGDTAVSVEIMRGALALVSYSLVTWRAFMDEGAAEMRGASALRLFEWLTTRPGWCESPAAIVNKGPACVRSKDSRNAALSELEAAGLVSLAGGQVVALYETASDMGAS